MSRVAKAKPKTPEPPPPLVLDTTTQFDRDVKRQEKHGKSLEKLHEIIETLRTRWPVDPQHKTIPWVGSGKVGETATSSLTGS